MVLYVLIFLAKIVEVSLMTLRTVLITRGEKVVGSIIGFFEVIIWLYLVSTVLVGISEDPIKMVVYALGFSVGNYVGSFLEEKLAIGLLTISIVASANDAIIIAEKLRKDNLGVTLVEAEGMNEKKKMIVVHVKRKRKKEVIKLIEDTNTKAVISIADTKTVYGGYGIKK
ncbi:DUF5698 domain-containing protein [Clostridium algidicarnis]|uniref:UPF0316 protein KPL27_01550 n=2 Tax=Clostridium algidicarnis TaxID=37659 RepID=A0ABS6C009_9CLOT|nr:DUF5698 domain-containing protein [Clostridium algidicarnis]MBB6630357.1 DUF2179 domain-containing protein [Clostridium algidicarnis]MBU3192840.1 DUF2179 domain-containing protein [Clostridium algidicarnis]MBU3203569.1 DUF2179 domain-containing protein [Clostridium algidicarnis]MBU3206125.1 DUF2179 domain-containing protein [Clostridium algidicarnis]MBU3211723.1 DUF2179 domain-containing protein [Clostridium algidicarnis]